MPSLPSDKAYLCYIHREGRSISDFIVLMCESDRALDPLLEQVLAGRDFVRVEVYDGDRRVLVRLPQTAGMGGLTRAAAGGVRHARA